jgi:hypothetical protein
MKKMPTLFIRDENDRTYVTEHVNPGCEWVLAGEGTPTRKYDGTCCMLDDDGTWWARREVKPGKETPANFVPVDHDEITKKAMGWEPIHQSSFSRWHAEALWNERITGRGSRPDGWRTGTYELLGPKINGNPESVVTHWLLRHASAAQVPEAPCDYAGLAEWLPKTGWEGLVFHHEDGRYCKIKAKDFRP